jgi:hypothetical protein
MPADNRRMQAASHVAQLGQRLGYFAARDFQPLLSSRVGLRLFGESAEFQGKSYQALLCTVVQVAFQAAALVLLSLDHPGTRALEFLQPSPQLCFESAIF